MRVHASEVLVVPAQAARVLAVSALAVSVIHASGPISPAADGPYRAEIDAWRQKREAGLKADGGWLTVAGLFWLKEGANRFGSAPDSDIVLPGSVPGAAGRFEVKGSEVSVRFADGVQASVDAASVKVATLHADSSGKAEVVSLGPLRMHVIERGGRLAIRLKDMNAAARRSFSGLRWFPIDESFKVKAKFVAYPELRPVAVPNVLGQVEKMPSPGYAVFQMGGREHRLEGVFEEPGATELFFIFKDKTSGQETYPSGRFVYSSLPRDGALELDFNKAYNPPCAFTEYATCPLPPKQNWLETRIAAGELRYGH